MTSSIYSQYDDESFMKNAVESGLHREIVGGLWDEVGRLQADLMVSRGLLPNHMLLDVGCGALRGGVHLVRYLDPGHYFGIDRSMPLIEAGYEKEIKPLGLEHKIPKSNLAANDCFDATGFSTIFDYAIAFSIFTHLPLDLIRVCLERVSKVLRPGGALYATFFGAPEDGPTGIELRHEPGGITTHAGHDPFHQKASDFRHLAAGLDLDVRILGPFGHPRGQLLVAFVKGHGAAATVSAQRRLSISEASRLPPGADHYRAYVGPPERYDLIGASQFALLFQFGLQDTHKVLDFGCGSLRLGRLLIPFLHDERYFGIDPNFWLIDEGFDRELGRSALDLKRPQFSSDPNFDCTVFGETFDFVIAQSIVTHAGPDLVETLFASAAKALKKHGVFLFSYIRDSAPGVIAATPGWTYPGCLGYSIGEIEGMLARAGFISCQIPWYHPGALWHAAFLTPEAIPSRDKLDALTGEIIR